MKLALTGMIGSGKTTALNELGRLGWQTISTDALARQVTESEEGRAFLQKSFGQLPDRAALRQRFLQEAAFRRAWEGFLHPRINERWRAQLAASPQANWAVEVPLLYEKELENHFDKVVVCICHPNVALARWVGSGRNAEDYQALQALMLTPDKKISRADFVLRNDDSAQKFLESVQTMHRELIK